MKTALSLLSLLLLPACSSDTVDPAPGLAACARIAERCHPYEALSLTASDCHRYAHANNATVCLAREAECLAACPSVADAGSADASLPASLCAEIGALCHAATTPAGVACHELGHADDPAMCSARHDACVAECSPRDAGGSDL